jgi:hypothetical protein
MKPAQRASLILASTNKTSVARDGRCDADHTRFYRGFVDVDYGGRLIRFYPLKRWVPVVRVVDQTLRTWLAQRIISAYVMFGMPVMCRAEMEALAAVAAQHNVSKRANTTEAFVKDAKAVLAEVRLALDSFKRGFALTERQSTLIAPSLNEKDQP